MRAPERMIEAVPSAEEIRYLEDRLGEFNAAATGIEDGTWLAYFVKDTHDRIIAGIAGALWGDCLEIRQFWVEASRRGQGLGTRLFAAAEHHAHRRGCRQIVLSTFSFQAPQFYERRGFEIVAVVDDCPRGHASWLMRKRLGVDSA